MIEFVPKGHKPRSFITPNIEFSDVDGEYIAIICYDDIPVAYLSDTGGIIASLFEIGPEFVGSANDKAATQLKYLQDNGVLFNKKPHRFGKKKHYEYTIVLERE